MSEDEILIHRKNKFLSIGRSKGFVSNKNNSDNLIMEMNYLEKVKNIISKNKNKFYFALLLLLLIIALFFFL